MRRSSLQEMECLRDAHRGWYLHDEMQMIRHDCHLDNSDTMPFSHLTENGFTKLFILCLVKHLVPVLGAPLKVVQTLANAIAPAIQLHVFTLWTGTTAPAPAGAPVQIWNNTYGKKGCRAAESEN